MLERLLTGALAAATPALLAVALAGAAFGPRFDLLHGGGAWSFLGAWAVVTAALAAVPDAVRRWRLAAGATGVVLLAAAVLVIVRSAGPGTSMAAALFACAAACGGLTGAVSHARVGRHKERGERRRTAASLADAAAGGGTARSRVRQRNSIAWGVCTCALVDAFVVAYAGATDAASAAGGLALLVVVLLLMPAAAMRDWYPRTAASAAAVAATLFIALAVRAGVPALAACAAAAAIVATDALLAGRGPAPARAAHRPGPAPNRPPAGRRVPRHAATLAERPESAP
jgi:hypothetical protein